MISKSSLQLTPVSLPPALTTATEHLKKYCEYKSLVGVVVAAEQRITAVKKDLADIRSDLSQQLVDFKNDILNEMVEFTADIKKIRDQLVTNAGNSGLMEADIDGIKRSIVELKTLIRSEYAASNGLSTNATGFKERRQNLD